MKNNKLIYLAFLLLSLSSVFFLENVKVTYKFDDVAKIKENWLFYNTGSVVKTHEGISISKGKNNVPIAFNKDINLKNLTWDRTPYVKIYITPEFHDRTFLLLWSPSGDINKSYTRKFMVPAHKDYAIVNIAQDIKFKRVFSWTSKPFEKTKINSFGFIFDKQSSVNIKKIELLSSLFVWDYIRLVINEYSLTENVNVSSINFLYGISILGKPLAYLLGILISIFGFILIIKTNRKSIISFIIISIVCLIFYDISLHKTLWNSAQYASKRSAWHEDKFEEYKSRFGERFAMLARELEKRIPKGSKVFFPPSQDYRVKGESNWIAFQYYGLYEHAGIDKVDYVFYYYPKGNIKFNNKTNILKVGKKEYKVKPVVNINNSIYILKTI